MGWFSRNKRKRADPVAEFTQKMFRPASLAAAITEVLGNYVRGVEEGRIEFPAHRRQDPRLAQTWSDVRLEALYGMYHFGSADIFLLADHARQRDLLAALLGAEPRQSDLEPTGEPVEDTLRAVSRVYARLQGVGSEVADSMTDGNALRERGAHVMDGFMDAARDLKRQFDEYDAASSGFGPETLIDVLWADVSAKSKSIALAAVFGPNPEDGMTFMLGEVAKQGSAQDVSALKASFDIIHAAKQPEDIARR